jgi:hypothetical protein
MQTRIIRTEHTSEQQKTQFKTYTYYVLAIKGTDRLALVQQITQVFSLEGELKRTDQEIKSLYFGFSSMSEAEAIASYFLKTYPDLVSLANCKYPNVEVREEYRLSTPYEVKVRFIKKIHKSLWAEFDKCYIREMKRSLIAA